MVKGVEHEKIGSGSHLFGYSFNGDVCAEHYSAQTGGGRVQHQ
jgi:hypothetical protein